MTDIPKIGEAIPLGTITRDTAVLGAAEKTEGEQPRDKQPMADQIDALRQELNALKQKIQTAGGTAVETAKARPLLTATLLSVGAWAIIALAYRRSHDQAPHAYAALKDRFDRWY